MFSDRNLLDTVLDEKEVELAKTAQRCIIGALDHSRAVHIALVEDGVERQADGAPVLRLPPKVLRLFAEMLGALSQGQPVAILPQALDVTTQQAAMFLSVSRPHLIKLLDDGKIPFHKVGKHRRIQLDDVMKFKSERRNASLSALQELSEQAQKLDMGY